MPLLASGSDFLTLEKALVAAVAAVSAALGVVWRNQQHWRKENANLMLRLGELIGRNNALQERISDDLAGHRTLLNALRHDFGDLTTTCRAIQNEVSQLSRHDSGGG